MSCLLAFMKMQIMAIGVHHTLTESIKTIIIGIGHTKQPGNVECRYLPVDNSVLLDSFLTCFLPVSIFLHLLNNVYTYVTKQLRNSVKSG